MVGNGGTALMHWDRRRFSVLTSIWRMGDLKTTLRCHARVHRDTAATSIIPGLILPVELVANNLATRYVNGRGLVTFKVSWQAGCRVGEDYGGRGTNASMTYYVAEHVMVNPLQMKDNVGEEGTKERDSRSGEHMTRWRCVWKRMGFCAADNLNVSNSTKLEYVPKITIHMPIGQKHIT